MKVPNLGDVLGLIAGCLFTVSALMVTFPLPCVMGVRKVWV